MKLSVNVPSSLKDINLGDYQKFIAIANSEDVDDIFIRQKMVQIFCNIPLLAVNKIPRKEFIEISNSLVKVLEEKPELNRITTINGTKYGFIPNLDDDLSFGGFVDLDGYMGDWKDFHKAMNVLYRPITLQKGENYLIEDYEGKETNANNMLDMDMETVMGAVVFFWNLSSELCQIIPKYLERILAENPQAREALEKNGAGINTYTSLLKEACSSLGRLLPST